MNIFKKFGHAASLAVQKIEDKNKFSAQINRLRHIMKKEEKAAEREYITLGRYYYENLRDKENDVTEVHCREIEQIEDRLNTAIDGLEKLYYDEAKSKSDKKAD